MYSQKVSKLKDEDLEIKRPELTSRGFYSEIITNVDYGDDINAEGLVGSQKKTSFLWQVKTEKQAPTIKLFSSPSKKLHLKDAERWMSYEEDDSIEFSVDTFKPKVQLQLQVYPFETTRSVATERLRRQFQAKNIRHLLDELDIQPSDMISLPLLQQWHPKKLPPKVNIVTRYLPLELFDDEEYDCRTPENWLELGLIKGVRNPLPAEAFIPVEEEKLSSVKLLHELLNVSCEWVNVAVMDYNPETKLWKILTLDGTKRIAELPRIYIMFKAEDPSIFAQRIKAAVDLRRIAESTLRDSWKILTILRSTYFLKSQTCGIEKYITRYKFYLNTMLLVDIPELDDDSLDRIFYTATRNNFIKHVPSWNKLVAQVQNNFQQTHCDLQFRLDAAKDSRLQSYVFIAEKEWATDYKVKMIKTGMRSFTGMREYFRWLNIYVIPESYRAMYLVVVQCLKVEQMSLFTNNYGIKHISLEEFEIIQTQATNNCIKFLQGNWVETIVYNIRMCLGDVGKGWFDINVRRYEIYEVSKLKRFMELVKYRMQYTLRVLVLNSIEMFIDLLETPCLPCLDVEEDFVWGPNLIDSSYVSKKVSAIFILQIKMDETCAFFSTNLDQFEKVLLKLYDTALTLTHKVNQVHPFLLSCLNFPSDLYLSSLGLLSDEVVEVRERFLLAYQKSLIILKAFAKEFHIHLDLFNLDIRHYVEKFQGEQHTASEVKEEVGYHYRMKAKLEETLPVTIIIGPFFVTCEQLRHFLVNKRQEIATKLLDMFCARMKQYIEDVLEEYNTIMEKLGQKPDSIETIFDIRDWMETIPMLVRTQEELVRRYLIEYDVLEHFRYALPQEDFENKWEAIGLPYRITKQIEITDNYLKEEEEKFYKIHLNDEFTIQEKIEGLTAQVVQMSKQKDFTKVHELAIDMRRLWKTMKETQEHGQLLNQRQKLFGIPVVPFDNLLKLIKEFEPYKTLWITASDWLRAYDMWMENPLGNVDGETVERMVTDMYKTIVKSVRVFAEIEAVQAVAIEVKNQIDEFKPLIPIIQSVRNPGMRPRHWEKFKDQTGVNIVWGPTTCFKDCLEAGFADFTEELVAVAENATKEYAIEYSLTKMMNEWEYCKMELNAYKDTGTYIMKIPEETQQMLDDHLVLTQQISFSPFKGPFSDEIDEWEERLKVTSEVIEEWMDVQKQWMYLEPILTSEDIRIQLPAESKKYGSMERSWRRIMRGARENPYILRYCADRKLLESLKDANHILEVVQKGLTDYLETKRMVFPRLYFLSDDELLEILSHAKNPLAVQPHLRKCFENIARLKFEEDLCITQMFSGEEECVDLTPTLYPTPNVENWLLLVETSMRNTVKTILGEALKTINNKVREEWVLDWPGQVVIAGSQTFWTTGVEEGIKELRLNEFLDEVVLVNLDALRDLVKSTMTFLQREILSALIVIEVHARDVTQTLVDACVSNINDFDWISQLRYYWVENDLKVRAVNAEFQYGYEYLGNSGRLVITPLTDRCYLTLTGALHLKFGGAPAGPAGTGKTETTKDLAKVMALQCVVFNCSDQLDFMAMGKFFKGLASSGAWACFDEFNRIDIEVLSVVAQQITTIQKAQQARLDVFLFEGSEIVLKESCAVFITMNPGYAGRTELPDNLKALFRPVSMMVPNYSLISEILLFSFGFSNAKQLANKITTTFKLSSEQLSTQDHYDFGMRAVKTVIAVAGNLKREKSKMDERQIVLRALRDVNVPKFLKDDLKLFNGIVSDLFPKMQEEPVDYGVLEESIRESCIKSGLQDTDEFVRKVIQLYETTIVRHGLMLVGPTASGKTKCYEVLKMAMTSLDGQDQPSGYPFRPVHTYVMNPKSITMGQLYGEFDLQTHEWTDGILPCLVRVGCSAEDKDKRWYVFDGPVDAVWIENMNSVLDDNKKLCLSSGEIIKLRDTMTMIFEVADLAVASPATVSRCGMVYLEPGVLGFDPFVNCWIKRLPPLARPYAEDLKDLIQSYVIPGIQMVRTRLREILTSVDSALLCKFFRLMDFWLTPITGRDNRPPPAPQFLALIQDLLVPWVVFSLVWSVGCTCDNKGRLTFDRWLRGKMDEEDHEPLFPVQGLVYDYKLHDGGFTDPTEDGQPAPPTWYSWMEKAEEYKINVDMKYSDIEVPTLDNVRNAIMIEIILNNFDNVLCVGPTGTGKSLTVVGKLSRSMHKKFICDFMSFSARTSANQTQDLIDSKLDRRRKGVFGPPVLKRQVFFIDDFNMPALEVYGAQPPIELIRQWMDFGGWFDRKNIGDFRYIIDTNFCVAMGPPEGGRNPVTARLLRHFHYLAFIEMEDDSKRKIFGTILNFWMERTPKEASLISYYTPVLEATLSIYSTILKELLPTPAKTHYTFNLRDLSKVFQGVLMFNPEKLKDINQIIRLWYHECCRVFQDRLVNDDDRNWFSDLLKMKIQSNFDINPKDALGSQILFFGDFMDPATDYREYEQVTDTEKLSQVLNHYLNEYNDQTTRPMKLVLFLDAISHVCRISRIIRQPFGNALLLGVGGSGRQSLTRLATFMAEYFCFQIEIHKTYGMFEWREDVKGLMLKSGIYRRETVFLFSDTQIKTEAFLEDLNNILNSGDVPNIYQPEELDKIFQEMKGIVQEMGMAATKSNLFAAYQKVVRSNLHSVVTMSPIGDIFRSRLRQFPALVNCCTIDWFSEWPDSALQSVALQFLDDISELNVGAQTLHGIVIVCQFMHASVVDASILYKQELSRYNYVTPTSYLELLSSYTDLMLKKRGSLSEGVARLSAGLGKLQSTAEEVKVLQAQLEEMKPALEMAAQDAEIMIKQIAEDQVVAEETKAVVEKEEMEAAKMKLETQTIADDAQRDLDEAMPDLLAAEASLKSLNKNDISEVRSMKRPPAGVVYVIESICIVKNIKPNKLPGYMPGEKIIDYWEPGRNMLADPGVFLASLMNFDKESITEEMIEKLKNYVVNPQFQPAKVAKVSKACRSLCMWVHAMYKYYFVNKRVAPKKAKLKEAKTALEKTEALLAIAKEKMREVMDNLRVLETKLAAKIAFKRQKEDGIQICQERMSRAVRLITGLSDERVRWLNTIASIEAGVHNVTGDTLLSAGAVAYLTPFTDKYRRGLLSEWLKLIQEQKIPCSPDANPVSILAEPVQIRAWQLDGLPRDFLSTENAVLVSNSKRWPLFIDPQGQANKWVKNMDKQLGLTICKMADKELLKNLETAIRFGKPVLIESVGTDLDPSLDPILLRQKFKQAGTWMLKLGEVVVPYDDSFHLYMTTKLPNPHYTPEICVKVLLVNFTLVPSGLQDQLLALVVMQERPDLEDQRSQLIVGSTQMKQELKEIEDRILYKLSSLEGSPLDDLDFIITLEASKVKSEDIKNKVVASEITQIDIDNTRALYIPVANRAQILFFCLSDLSNVDPMYQYSLEWFVGIFIASMADTETADNIDERVEIINEYFTYSLYSNVCRSLFEKHKLHFAFLMCARILMNSGKIDAHEWHHFLAGGSPLLEKPNPAPEWLSAKSWKEILALEVLPNFISFVTSFENYKSHYQSIFESPDPHKQGLPAEIESHLTQFQKLLVLKCLRPDKVTNAMQDFISDKMGQRFVEPQTTDLAVVFKDSGPTTPLIFVLSTGTDPAADLYKFADKMKFTKRMFSISLGQGQGPLAEKMLQNGTEIGSWVFFQNCHLSPSWMPRLDRLIENIAPEFVHRDFRIWLTSTPSPHFPVSILQNSSKMTVEPPSGIKANIMRAYTNQVSDLLDTLHGDSLKNFEFKWLLFSLCLFHGVLLERRKFGPLGFNIPYEFTDGDLKICISQLKMFLWEYSDIPFKVLTYTAGHINYGGRVTDDWDRRCLMNVLADYYNENVVDAEYVFDSQGLYHQLPSETSYYDYLDYIKGFPINDDPELFGLHQNADITFAQAQTYRCLSTLLALQPKQVGGAAASEEEVISHAASFILEHLPKQFDLEAIADSYPVLYEESLNTVLIQESIRYNKLLTIIETTLKQLLKAIKGLVVMSEALDKMSTSLFSNIVPELWASKAYPSLKPLGAWVTDLHARTNFLIQWVKQGIPPVFWISGFYFPQAFLTATLQNYARKYIVSIDTINFSSKVFAQAPKERPVDGCCIYGLFLEGARWNYQRKLLDESLSKELYTDMPVVWLLPEEFHEKPNGVYECPVYKTLTRAGVLSTTGHSTNYVVAIEVPSEKSEAHWIKRGVALICALDY